MRKASFGAWVLGTTLLVPLPVLAQADPAATTQPVFRKWDAGGSFGFRFIEAGGRDANALLPEGAWTLNIGHYWTLHFKTEASVTLAAEGERYRDSHSESLPGFGYRSTVRTVAPTSLAVATTYQAFDNVFVHPYVSGGARLESESTETYTYFTGQQEYQRRPSSRVVRPFIAAGFKSYFHDGRTFMRSEFMAAVGSRGSAVMVRIGAGFDF